MWTYRLSRGSLKLRLEPLLTLFGTRSRAILKLFSRPSYYCRLGRCVLRVVLLVLWRKLFTWALPFGIPPWPFITRLCYGVPQEAISAALQPCGKVLNVKMYTYKGVYVGVRNVLMEVTTPIPSSLKIAEHWVNVFYPGQTPTFCLQTKWSY